MDEALFTQKAKDLEAASLEKARLLDELVVALRVGNLYFLIPHDIRMEIEDVQRRHNEASEALLSAISVV